MSGFDERHKHEYRIKPTEPDVIVTCPICEEQFTGGYVCESCGCCPDCCDCQSKCPSCGETEYELRVIGTCLSNMVNAVMNGGSAEIYANNSWVVDEWMDWRCRNCGEEAPIIVQRILNNIFEYRGLER